ncbi:hypothetical protein F0344_20000 [Streptomyces finlayi]|uniref:Leucine-rich repeat domain-containing protein n=1 Tax=Streptomyces finlayi TaxID=67296 RepID=A0A7G7BMN9_9ACTN|nr:hypothetical protein [Streptomyces finlayi]QNE76604.1 hypothetical protein F0344_20000 [Streptomyces finlayi]
MSGSLRARNVFLSGCPNVVVHGDLEVAGGVCTSHGDDGGILTVRGRTRAQLVIGMLYFNLVFAEQPQALDAVLLPELLDDHGMADARKIQEALREGRQVLRAGVRPSHLATLEELDALLGRAEEVTELDLSERKLRHFPEQLLSFPNLRVLSLAGNAELKTIDPRIGELASLEELTLAGAQLTGLPESIGRLRNLRHLQPVRLQRHRRALLQSDRHEGRQRPLQAGRADGAEAAR